MRLKSISTIVSATEQGRLFPKDPPRNATTKTNKRRRELGPAAGSTPGHTRGGFLSVQQSITATPLSGNGGSGGDNADDTVNSKTTTHAYGTTDGPGSNATEFFDVDRKGEKVG